VLRSGTRLLGEFGRSGCVACTQTSLFESDSIDIAPARGSLLRRFRGTFSAQILPKKSIRKPRAGFRNPSTLRPGTSRKMIPAEINKLSAFALCVGLPLFVAGCGGGVNYQLPQAPPPTPRRSHSNSESLRFLGAGRRFPVAGRNRSHRLVLCTTWTELLHDEHRRHFPARRDGQRRRSSVPSGCDVQLGGRACANIRRRRFGRSTKLR
jgi:hypothetical protein